MTLWEEVDLPVLLCLGRAEDADRSADAEELAEDLELTESDIARSLRRLFEAEPPLILGVEVASFGAEYALLDLRLSERGRRYVGNWPLEEAGTAMLSMIEERANDSTSRAERSKWEKFRAVAVEVGAPTLGELIAALVARGIG